jgi:hypothetical protein
LPQALVNTSLEQPTICYQGASRTRKGYVKALRYNIWLDDVDGWDELSREIWPQLEFLNLSLELYSEELGVRSDEFDRVFHDKLSGLPVACSLQSFEIELLETEVTILDQIFRLTPNLSQLKVGFLEPNGSTMTEPITDSEAPPSSQNPMLLRLSRIAIGGCSDSSVAWIIRLLQKAPSVTSIELVGDVEINDPKSVEALASAIKGSRQVAELHWLLESPGLGEVFSIWSKDDRSWPDLRRCTVHDGRDDLTIDPKVSSVDNEGHQ